MIKEVAFKYRKNKDSHFETVLILTAHGLSKVLPTLNKSIEDVIEQMNNKIKNRKNIEVEVIIRPSLPQKRKQNKSSLPIRISPTNLYLNELEKKFNSLTLREREMLKYIL